MALKIVSNDTFFDLYIVQKVSKKDIIETYPMNEKTWIKYKKIAHSMQLNDITTESLEREVLKLYNASHDQKYKKDLFKIITDIWKIKHKVPTESKEKTLDLKLLKTMGDPTASTS